VTDDNLPVPVFRDPQDKPGTLAQAFSRTVLRAVTLVEPTEVLRRQVHPNLLGADGIPQSVAFRPNVNDSGRLSTLRGSVSAEDAMNRHAANGLQTAGTWGVSVGEANAADLPCIDDSKVIHVEDHVSIDFRPRDRKQTDAVAKKLKAAARDRGRLYPPP
jgi:hypothetical protein